MRRVGGIAIVSLALSLGIGGCGGDDSGTSTSSSSLAATGATGASGASGVEGPQHQIVIENLDGPQGYQDLVTGALTLLERDWAQMLPDLGGDFSPPDAYIAYNDPSQDPDCNGDRFGAENAGYCAPDNILAWDQPGLLIPYFKELGGASVGFVLAHEYGHLVQDRLGIIGKFHETIEKELNADCLAGAWFKGLHDSGTVHFNKADYNSIAAGIFAVSDANGTAWNDPNAHGNLGQRTDALTVGIHSGAQACLDKLGPGFTD